MLRTITGVYNTLTVTVEVIKTVKGGSMTRFHTTVSRREFMKGLGLAGSGLGAASVIGANFTDLDEMVVANNAGIGNPWWVQEREAYNPTNGVDWDFIKPFAPDFQGYRFGIKEGDPFPEVRSQWELAQLKANAPGMSLRDIALDEGWLFARRNSTANGLYQVDFTGEKVTTPEERGVPARKRLLRLYVPLCITTDLPESVSWNSMNEYRI
jgi:hypothetical protein